MGDPGPARVLVAVYAVFALAAGARAVVQLLTAASRAPVAYALSAVAAAIYLVAAFALARGALIAIGIELAGVVLVGAVTRPIRRCPATRPCGRASAPATGTSRSCSRWWA